MHVKACGDVRMCAGLHSEIYELFHCRIHAAAFNVRHRATNYRSPQYSHLCALNHPVEPWLGFATPAPAVSSK
jgi:hypothetical protein